MNVLNICKHTPSPAWTLQLVSRAVVGKKDEKKWRLEDSIFMKRVRENDARSVYDTPEVRIALEVQDRVCESWHVCKATLDVRRVGKVL